MGLGVRLGGGTGEIALSASVEYSRKGRGKSGVHHHLTQHPPNSFTFGLQTAFNSSHHALTSAHPACPQVRPGQSLFIPCGWVYSAVADEDTVSVGTLFWNPNDIPAMLQVGGRVGLRGCFVDVWGGEGGGAAARVGG